jgi:nucleoside-diphosphate-sugar epimerase
VHLSGAPIAARRWTAARKQVLRASRIDSTRVLAAAMAETDPRPDVLICASATGYYGDTGDRVVDESSARGSGFLAELVGDWEAAAEPARAAGIRVVHIRSGLVFGPAGGMVGRLLLPFRLGVGARVGSGRQYMSWISLTDEVRAIRFLLDTPGVGGAERRFHPCAGGGAAPPCGAAGARIRAAACAGRGCQRVARERPGTARQAAGKRLRVHLPGTRRRTGAGRLTRSPLIILSWPPPVRPSGGEWASLRPGRAAGSARAAAPAPSTPRTA